MTAPTTSLRPSERPEFSFVEYSQEIAAEALKWLLQFDLALVAQVLAVAGVGMILAIAVVSTLRRRHRPSATSDLNSMDHESVFSRPSESTPQRPERRLEEKKNPCRWKIAGFRHGTTTERWICTTCGADGFTRNGKPPEACQKDFRDIL